MSVTQNATVTLTLVIYGVLNISTTSLPPAVEGQAYSAQLSATGGSGTYVWSLASGSSLPAGLSLSASGLISGTPSVSGSFSFTVEVQG